MMKRGKALLLVDVQNDFCSGGALAVPGGDDVVPVLNAYIDVFLESNLPIFASRDWHPRNSRHFRQFGGQWPIHCVQNTKGARFHPRLNLPKDVIILSKGMDPEKDTYSDFESFDSNGVAFLDILRILGIDELFVGGLATDYCVKFTVLDALKSGFKVRLLVDGIKGVNLKPRDSEMAMREMVERGARKLTFKQFSSFSLAKTPERCDHIGLFTRNSKRLENFYTDMLRFKKEKEEVVPKSLMKTLLGVNSDCILTRLQSGTVKLELFQLTSVHLRKRLNTTAGYNHWGYRVDDREKFVRKLKREGVKVLEAKRGDYTVYFVKDPDGNRIEIRD